MTGTIAALNKQVEDTCQQPCTASLGSSGSGGFGSGGFGGSSSSSCCIDKNGNFSDAFGNNLPFVLSPVGIVTIRPCDVFHATYNPYYITQVGLSFPCNNNCGDGGLCLIPKLSSYACCKSSEYNTPCAPRCSNLESFKVCTNSTVLSSWQDGCNNNGEAGGKCHIIDNAVAKPGCCVPPQCNATACISDSTVICAAHQATIDQCLFTNATSLCYGPGDYGPNTLKCMASLQNCSHCPMGSEESNIGSWVAGSCANPCHLFQSPNDYVVGCCIV